MAEKNRQIAEAVVKAVGGTANITSVTHCMTRLRFVLKDKSIPNKKEVEKIPGVMGVNIAGGQYQVIIGNSVRPDQMAFILRKIIVRKNCLV